MKTGKKPLTNASKANDGFPSNWQNERIHSTLCKRLLSKIKAMRIRLCKLQYVNVKQVIIPFHKTNNFTGYLL